MLSENPEKVTVPSAAKFAGVPSVAPPSRSVIFVRSVVDETPVRVTLIELTLISDAPAVRVKVVIGVPAVPAGIL
jgi:hypothetical protein